MLVSSLFFFVSFLNSVEYGTATILQKVNPDSRSVNDTSIQAMLVERGKQVDIVPDAILKGREAYYPNPIAIQEGDFISWVNTDTILHTATSGIGIEDDEKGDVFDSPVLRPGEAYSLEFRESGEFPYFCFLHPTMVGMVTVSD